MFIESTTFQWVETAVAAGAGGLAAGIPLLIYFLGQNSDRKKEITSSFTSINDRRDVDQRHFNDAMGELRDRTTKLQTTVDIKRETVDSVQAEQNRAGVRLAVVESNVTSIRESQARSEQNWLKVSEKLEILGRIEETVKNLADDMREVRAEQSKQSE